MGDKANELKAVGHSLDDASGPVTRRTLCKLLFLNGHVLNKHKRNFCKYPFSFVLLTLDKCGDVFSSKGYDKFYNFFDCYVAHFRICINYSLTNCYRGTMKWSM